MPLSRMNNDRERELEKIYSDFFFLISFSFGRNFALGLKMFYLSDGWMVEFEII